jgi:hypothetical protein
MGKQQTGVSSNVSQGELANETALTQIAQQQQANSQTLFNQTEPGLASAENFYGTLSSGDPYAIARAISPATQQISQATAGAKQNIMQNSPAGGEKNLALEQADVNQGAQVGQTATGGFLNSYNALAQIAGQGVGESISAAGTGISSLSAANQAFGQIGNQQLEAQQLQAQQKGSSLGALSSFGGSAVEAGATLGASGKSADALAALAVA